MPHINQLDIRDEENYNIDVLITFPVDNLLLLGKPKIFNGRKGPFLKSVRPKYFYRTT